MVSLSVHVLGTTQVVRDGRVAGGSSHDKVCALLAYLAIECDRPHRRESLAELLWPDLPEGRGRHSLRQALVTLRQMLGDQDQHPPLILATRDSIQMHPEAGYDLDVHVFDRHLRSLTECDCRQEQRCDTCIQHLKGAIECYRGDLLADLVLDGCPGFEVWLQNTRIRLRSKVLVALHQYGDVCLQSGEYLQAGDLARRQLVLDPIREEAHRQLMLALHQSGDRSAALAHYDRCRQLLQDEIGVEPDEETTALRNSIRNGPAPVKRPHKPTVRLPVHPTQFFGRERELANIETLLTGPDCRLLTLTGPGGAGKTRLAVESATLSAHAFSDGVHFVSLASLTSRDELVSAMADALLLSFVDRIDLEQALFRYLRDRNLLLILDNFEQLVHVSSLITAILEEAPMLRLVVTSRQRIELHEEWIIDLSGLHYPDEHDPARLLESDSARLFVESAQRANSRLTLDEDEVIAIGRICRLVDGMPLALELAAAWSPVLSCAEMAEEIAKSIDFLSSSFRDVPDRHRSMRAVFDCSWDLLSDKERGVFTRLSIFRGGFGRHPAEEVAGANLGILSALVSKSLIVRSDQGRLAIHDLLRQYGEAKLWGMRLDHQQTSERHAEYYCALLSEREESLRGHDQVAALHELSSEIENVRAAWRWAVEHDRADLLLQAAHGMWIFLEVSSRYAEIDALFGLAVERLRDGSAGDKDPILRDQALASMVIRHGAALMRLGDSHRGEAEVGEGCDAARSLGVPATLGLGLNFKGMFALERLDQQSAAIYLRESIECFNMANDRWGVAYSTSDLSVAVSRLGEIEEAEALHNQAVRIFTEIGDKRGLAFALHNRGIIARQTGLYTEARQCLLKALEIWGTINHLWAMSMTLIQLGTVARAAGDLDQSRQYLLRALQVAHDIQSQPAILSALTEIAANLAMTGSTKAAVQLLNAVLNHPASDSAAGARAGELLTGLEADTVAIDGNSRDNDNFEIEQFSRELLRQSSGVPVV